MADAVVSKTTEGNLMSVRLRPPAPLFHPLKQPHHLSGNSRCLLSLKGERVDGFPLLAARSLAYVSPLPGGEKFSIRIPSPGGEG